MYSGVKHMKKRIYKIITALLVSGLVLGCAYMVACVQNKTRAYDYAVTLIRNGAYEEALGELEKLNPEKIDRDDFLTDVKYNRIEKPYKNSVPLYAYALAQIEYNGENRMSTVGEYLEPIPEAYSGELSEEIKSFRENFQAEYTAYLEEEAREAEERRREKLKKMLPYVGMRESDIANTSLGEPDPEVRHDYEIISGEAYRANIYDFKSDSKTIFTARCYFGSVREVWDRRNETKNSTYTPPASNETKKNTYTPPAASEKKSTYTSPATGGNKSTYTPPAKGKKTYNGDDYDVKDYYDAEDFYEDHYDDFYDYEEAEEYFNENGMW